MDSSDANVICDMHIMRQTLGECLFCFIFSYFLTIGRDTTTLLQANHNTESPEDQGRDVYTRLRTPPRLYKSHDATPLCRSILLSFADFRALTSYIARVCNSSGLDLGSAHCWNPGEVGFVTAMHVDRLR